MDEAGLQLLETGKETDLLSLLTAFNGQHAHAFSFPSLSGYQKQDIVRAIISRLHEPLSPKCHMMCLETIRILSRDKTDLDIVFKKEVIDTMVQMAGLKINEETLGENNSLDAKQMIEAQKCLCNLIFNSTTVQRTCCSNGCIDGIMLRLRTYKEPGLPQGIKFFDMRMLFLITALCTDVRPRLRHEFHGLTYLMEVIDLILKNNAEQMRTQTSKGGKKHFSKSSRRGRGGQVDKEAFAPLLDNDEVDLACEVLKVLFNLTVNVDKFNLDEEEEAHYMRLVSILHDILLCDAKDKDKKEELQSHTVNLLTNMPASSFEELLIPLTDIPGGHSENVDLDCEGMNMEVIHLLLGFMEQRLEKCFDPQVKSPGVSLTQKELLAPILSCLCECARGNRYIRKFLRGKILPPLKDIANRPEDGTTLRNRLVRLMTSPITDVKDLVADFLFVLCKESVGRLIKYTGYGNAAGLLANRGLMHGRSEPSGDYSSESEDSDTEEYLKFKDRINPVTGCYEEPRPDPMEGMTEEQKEYEAMQLVSMMDKLARDGVIQPMMIGEDGRPKPIDHILELQENVHKSSHS